MIKSAEIKRGGKRPGAGRKSKTEIKLAPIKQEWPADHVERRSVAALVPYARNARTHSAEQVDQIAASIREWGWTTPVLLDEKSGIIAGHGRVLAAKRLGLADIPVMIAVGWSEAQKRAYVIADNKLALNAGWDDSILRVELGSLKALNFDIGLTGFSLAEFTTLTVDEAAGATDPDEVPEAEEATVSVLGDVWLLGRHRLVCGDATSAENVDAVLAGAKPHLMVTDPPYGVNYDADWRNRAARKCEKMGNRKIGAGAIGKILNDNQADWSLAWTLFFGDVAYVWCAPGPLNCAVHDSLCDSNLYPRMQIVWAKSQLVIGRGDYHAQHENCWYAVRKGAVGHWNGDRTQSTLWQITKPRKSETGHSTQKPVECMKRPIENNSQPGDAVYDPFSGSGTTIIAAEMTKRRCLAIELHPPYVDVGVLRWQNFTTHEATLEATGETFAQVKARRLSTEQSLATVA